MSSDEPALGEADHMAWLEALKPDPDEGKRLLTEAEYRAWLEWRQPQVAAELTELLPQDVRDAGYQFEWLPSGPALKPDGIEIYGMVLPKWPDAAPWMPFRNRIPSATKCYRLTSGSMVHVQPGCRCPR